MTRSGPGDGKHRAKNHLAQESDPENPSQISNYIEEFPDKWIYRSLRLGPITLPYYASPASQMMIISFVCFLCPGMFSALTGIGGGGLSSARVQSLANTALNCALAVGSFFSGTILNRLGIRLTLTMGAFGYIVYTASFLTYYYTSNEGFVIFAGTLLGFCAAMLWTSQGAAMISYPTDDERGRFISRFWMILNMGGVVGSLIAMLQNLKTENDSFSSATYIGFMVLMGCGAILSLTLVDVRKVIRHDKSRVMSQKATTWKQEFKNLWKLLRKDTLLLILLFPMFLSSNWFYPYQFNDYNLVRFNTRTRAFNALLYWFAQIVAAYIIGHVLDWTRLGPRQRRAHIAWFILMVTTFSTWVPGYFLQRNFTRETAKSYKKLDWSDRQSGSVGLIIMYIAYGAYDALWQTCIYWLMGGLTDCPRTLANYSGMLKAVQSIGSAVAWSMDDLNISYINILISSWVLMVAALIFLIPVVYIPMRSKLTPQSAAINSSPTLSKEIGAADGGNSPGPKNDHGKINEEFNREG